jgi:phytoene dehydrogenase-like protein
MTDAIVIGAGPDELAAAHQLLRAGRRVIVVQEHAAPAHTEGWVPRALAMPGVIVDQPDPWLRSALPNGGTLELWQDPSRSAEAIRRMSPRDADVWSEFCDRMAKLAALLEELYLAPPPGLVDLRFALKIRRLGRVGMEDLMRLLPMPVAELLDDWFESDALKGALGALAVRDLQQGPRSAGTAFRLLTSRSATHRAYSARRARTTCRWRARGSTCGRASSARSMFAPGKRPAFCSTAANSVRRSSSPARIRGVR